MSEKFQMFLAPVDILTMSDLSIYEKMAYIAIRSYMDKNSNEYPSYPTIAKVGSMSRRKAIYAVKSLVEKELIIKRARFDVLSDSSLNRLSNEYKDMLMGGGGQ